MNEMRDERWVPVNFNLSKRLFMSDLWRETQRERDRGRLWTVSDSWFKST